MAIFRRKRESSGAHPVSAFWAWWAEEGHRVDPHGESPMTDRLSRLVDAIHPDLAWQFSAGSGSQHRLTVSAGGIAAIRPSAERWLRAAPPADATWEFRSSQEADPDALSAQLEIGGHRVDLSETVFGVEPVAEELRVHVGVFHPVFADLPDRVRGQVTFLVLDWLLGEDDVERWVGHVEVLEAPPVPAATAADLTRAVAEIAAACDPEAWTLAQWTDADGAPGLAMFRRGLRWLDHPTLDRHHELRATYDSLDNGLPAAGELDRLREIEDQLEPVLGGRAVLIGHETHRGVRTFHVYSDGEDQNAEDALASWSERAGLSRDARPDPAWSEVRRFTG